jgi:hypothetical protein
MEHQPESIIKLYQAKTHLPFLGRPTVIVTGEATECFGEDTARAYSVEWVRIYVDAPNGATGTGGDEFRWSVSLDAYLTGHRLGLEEAERGGRQAACNAIRADQDNLLADRHTSVSIAIELAEEVNWKEHLLGLRLRVAPGTFSWIARRTQSQELANFLNASSPPLRQRY